MKFPNLHKIAIKRHNVTPASRLKAAENLGCDVVTFFEGVRHTCARPRMDIQIASHRHIYLYSSILLFNINRLGA